ncbi:MAG: hypothetical protein II721_05710 [Bacilli bacterium]|nr:hypothetical protein [Bacilli bacterium]
MKKNITKLSLLCLLPLVSSCGSLSPKQEEEKPITDGSESTIIKSIDSTDPYLEKKDYKSLAYGFIYNIKEGLKSYESETKGSVKAKVAFFDYDITYTTLITKSGSTFYSHEDSKSALFNLTNEFYSVDKEKILVSRSEGKYDVYKMDEYHKATYSPDQFTIQGYVFNEESILKCDVISDKGEDVTIRYTLDNDAATNLVKVDMKNNGDLSNYPSFKKINITLSMKHDFTPVYYSIESVYDATKPFVGSSEATQTSKCVFSSINEKVVIPNEAFLAEKLGTEPSELIIDDSETLIKNELIAAAKKLDFANGVGINGRVDINIVEGMPVYFDISGNVCFDLNKISKEKIYKLLSLDLNVEGNENFSSVAGLISTFAKQALGEYASILDGFKSLEIVYDEEGGLYLVPLNQEGLSQTIVKVKLVDILDLILKNVDIVGLVSSANSDFLEYEKIEGEKQGDCEIILKLKENAAQTVKEKFEGLFTQDPTGMLKAMLRYVDFGELSLRLGIQGGVLTSLDASLSYIKQAAEEGGEDSPYTLIALHLDAKSEGFDFSPRIDYAKELYNSYTGVMELKNRIKNLLSTLYSGSSYLAELKKAKAEYDALSEQEKTFVGKNYGGELERAIASVEGLSLFLKTFYTVNLNALNNETILILAKALSQNSLSHELLKKEIGEEAYNIITSLSDRIDYSVLDAVIPKLIGEDEKAWGLSEKEIRDMKLLFDIGQYISSVDAQIMLKLYTASITMDINVLKEKINNLYNALN